MATFLESLLCGIIYASVVSENIASTIEDKSRARSQLLDRLLNRQVYDPRLRPGFGGGPVIVTVGFWILSIDKIDVVNMVLMKQLFSEYHLELKT